MPGIAGIIGHGDPAEYRRRVTVMLRSMMHEPFYTHGMSSAPELGAYVGWVAHTGSFAASESRTDEFGNTLAFAGESFHQPAENVLSLYERLQDGCVGQLNGMFSGFLIDRRRQRALLFNDRYGTERLYVHESKEATYFASEAKALLSVVPGLRNFDDEGVAEFLTFGCPLNGRTLFREVRTVEGGSVWVFQGAACRKSRYFTPDQWESQETLEAEEFHAQFRERFKSVVSRYVRSDRRIGLSLTGGLDTRMIMGCLPVLSRSPISYTFASLEGATLDVTIAARVAAACSLEHRLVRIGKDFLSDFQHYVDRTVYITDGSCGATGAHEIYLNALARQLAPIRITGNFGSEILRGVTTLKRLCLSANLVTQDFRLQMDRTSRALLPVTHSPITFAAFHEVPTSLFGIMAAAKSQVVYRSPYLDNDLVSLAYRAPEMVRTSPQTALRLVSDTRLELSRIPTDRGVLIEGTGLRYGLNRLLAEVTFKLDYFHKEDLPDVLLAFERAASLGARAGLLGRHKFLRYRLWFRHELAAYVAETLAASRTRSLPYWNQAFLARMAPDHVNGRHNYLREVNAVLTLAAVHRTLISNTDQRPAAGLDPPLPAHESPDIPDSRPQSATG